MFFWGGSLYRWATAWRTVWRSWSGVAAQPVISSAHAKAGIVIRRGARDMDGTVAGVIFPVNRCCEVVQGLINA
ncbi:MAG: hypothetical protein DHS20C16_02540 [Phycisphaerae bacterium]|nr:MAG: hypothetical protein DHS20C16_02540 [Phycisphaerae bacterium]